jgi:hypothetical protein
MRYWQDVLLGGANCGHEPMAIHAALVIWHLLLVM